jgi:hypothetical protein
MTEQLVMFKLGGKVESKIVKDYTLSLLFKSLKINELEENTKNLLHELLTDDYTANLTLKDNRALKLYFNILMKYPKIKDKAELIDIIATKKYYEIIGGENSSIVLKVLNKYLDKIDEKDYEEPTMMENKTINSREDIPSLLLEVMPIYQIEALIGNTEIYPTLVNLERDIKETPKLYEQDGKGEDSIVHFHYFSSNSDWFITELDLEKKLMFGYVVLNGDLINSEFGYISLDEITSMDVELDFNFDKMTVKQAITKYHGE